MVLGQPSKQCSGHDSAFFILKYLTVGRYLKKICLQQAKDKLQPLDIKVEAQNRDWMVKKGMGAFLTVANGSCTEPVFLECVYNGAETGKAPVLLSASGITFERCWEVFTFLCKYFEWFRADLE